MQTYGDGIGTNRTLLACLLCVWLPGAWTVGAPAAQDGEVVHIQQGFDDAAAFKPGKITGTGDATAATGAWTGQDEPAFEVVTSPVRSGPHALRIARVDTLKRMLLFRDNPLLAKHNFTVSFWCHADIAGSMALFLYTDKVARTPPTAGVSLSSQCRLRAYNPALPGVNKWVFTGQRAPQSAWFRCQLRFDVVQKLYWLVLTTEDGKTSESEPFPFLKEAPIRTLQFLNVPPAGNSVVIDDIEVAYERAPADTISGRRNWVPEATLKLPKVGAANDNDNETGIELRGEPATFSMELKTNSPVSLIRIHSGRPDGSGQLSTCEIQGLSAAGQMPTLASRKAPKVTGDGYVEYTFSPEMLSSLTFALHGDGKGIFLREVGVYSPPVPPASMRNATFAKLVYGEFRLPVYEDQAVARLHLFNVRDDGKAHQIGVTLTERFTGKVIEPRREVALPPGETKIEFAIAKLSDGSYIATVEDLSTSPGGRLRRLLRVQHIVPAAKQAVYHMTGKRLFFPDEHYLERYSNLSFRSCRGTVVQAVKPTAKSADFTQLGKRIYFDKDGKLNVLFRRLDRRWMREKTNRDFIATATNDTFDAWSVKPLVGKADIPPQGTPVWDAEPPKATGDWRAKRIGGKPVPMRLYNPKTDGDIKLNQVAIRRVSRSAKGTMMHSTDLDWSALKPLGGSVWPIWFKAPGVGLVLTREPLLQEMPLLIGDLEDPKAANDNWAGQFLSDDGSTLTYIHANVLRRCPPFNAPWDNLAKSSRILTVYRTTDGIRYTRSHMALPDEQDPPASQHYGAIIRRAAGGGGLRLAYLLRYKAYTQQIDTVASYSWDGVRWGRFHGQDTLAENGPHGSWSAGHVWTGYVGVERDGKVYHLIQRLGGIYHFQSEVANSRTDADIGQVTAAWMRDRYGPRQLEKSPLFPRFGSWQEVARHTRETGVGVGVLIYRKDGLFCVEAKDKEGELLTLPLIAEGSLQVNAEIAAGGALRLELTDAAGTTLPDYSGANAVQLKPGDYMDQPVRFGALKRLPAGQFKIRAKLIATKLYTLTVAE